MTPGEGRGGWLECFRMQDPISHDWFPAFGLLLIFVHLGAQHLRMTLSLSVENWGYVVDNWGLSEGQLRDKWDNWRQEGYLRVNWGHLKDMWAQLRTIKGGQLRLSGINWSQMGTISIVEDNRGIIEIQLRDKWDNWRQEGYLRVNCGHWKEMWAQLTTIQGVQLIEAKWNNWTMWVNFRPNVVNWG
jgi:hypothetical protein